MRRILIQIYETNKMTELTSLYERIIYRGDAEGNAWDKYRDILGVSDEEN